MKFRISALVVLLSTFAACGSGDADVATSLAGHWTEPTGSDVAGMTVEFDSESDELMVHTAPRPDGTHDHLHGTYTFDAEAKTVILNCALLGEAHGDVWRGRIDGKALIVSAGETELTFHKSADPHEKK